MIDTDKYEGHTPGPWRGKAKNPRIHHAIMASGDGKMVGIYYGTEKVEREDPNEDPYESIRAIGPRGEWADWAMADATLIADAPLLLAEVKRLYELHTLIGVSIPWKVDYGDGGGYDTFVADAVVWNYDDSGEWGLVNYNETRWMTLETAKEWMDKAQQYLESEEE